MVQFSNCVLQFYILFLLLVCASSDDMISYAYFHQTAAIPVSSAERTGEARCSFINEKKNGVADCAMETMEHNLVDKYIEPSSVVLEIGARYGTTSCQIASIQNNSGLIFSVEPDHTVWSALSANRETHKCHFVIIKGTVSEIPLNVVGGAGYGTRAVAAPVSSSGSTEATSTPIIGRGRLASPASLVQRQQQPSTRHVSLSRLQKHLHVKFNTLLIDCEGCIDTIFPLTADMQPHVGSDLHPQTNSDAMSLSMSNSLRTALAHVHTIIIEGDMPIGNCVNPCVNYTLWRERLETVGYTQVHSQQDPVFKWIQHMVFQRAAL